MNKTLVRTAVKILTALNEVIDEEWFEESGRKFRWAVDTLCRELETGKYFVEDYSPGKSRVACPDKKHVIEIQPRVEALLDIARVALETGYEHLVGKNITFVSIHGVDVTGTIKGITLRGIIRLADKDGKLLTVDADKVFCTEIDPATPASEPTTV